MLQIFGLFKRHHRKKTQIQTDYYFDKYFDIYGPFKFNLENKKEWTSM
jgi:predicted porin